MDLRHFIMGAARAAGLFLLTGCDARSWDDRFVRLLEQAENLTYRVHRRLTPRRALERLNTATQKHGTHEDVGSLQAVHLEHFSRLCS